MVDSSALFAMARAIVKAVVPAGSMVGGQQGIKTDSEISASVPIYGLGSTDGSTTTAPFAKPIRMDLYAGQAVADFFEHYSNRGMAFSITDYDGDVDIVAPKYWRITTPASTKRCHLMAEIAFTGSVLVEFYENPTITVAGTALTPRNMDRNSATVSTMSPYYDPTVTVDGTLLFTKSISGAGALWLPAYYGKATKMVLKANEDYIIKITPVNDNTELALNAGYVEIDA